jgi:hypothetical protein
VEWAAASSMLSGAAIRGEGNPRGTVTTGGHWHRARPPEIGATRGTGRPSLVVNRKRAADLWPRPVKYIFKYLNSTQMYKSKREAFLCSKNIQTLYAARFQYFQQLSQLGRLQSLNRIYVINSGTYFNLILP